MSENVSEKIRLIDYRSVHGFDIPTVACRAGLHEWLVILMLIGLPVPEVAAKKLLETLPHSESVYINTDTKLPLF